MAKPYRTDMDFAFFVVNFGYTKRDYDDLTEREKIFIRKAWENKTVSDSTVLRDAVYNAVSNVLRKKGKRFKELWKKKPRHGDSQVKADNLATVKEIEKKEVGWIDKIYQANKMKKPERKGKTNG